jgi:hypothetical protein
MAYCRPPKEYQFTSATAPRHTKKGPYLTPILNKLLNAKWEFHDKKIKTLLKDLKMKETIGTALVLRRILNGTEGDDLAIERIFDRIDGKVKDHIVHEEKNDELMREEIELIPPNGHGVPERLQPFLKN